VIVPALLLALGVAVGIDWRRLSCLGLVVVAPALALVVGAVLVVRAPRWPADVDDVAILGTIASDLRAGRSLRAALAAGLGTDPASPAGRAGRRARLGLPMSEVVGELDDAFGGHGRLVTASLRLVDRRGGSAIDALDAAALLVREDRELSRELAAATAPARLSAFVVGGAPLVLLAWQAADGALSRAVAVPGGAVMLVVGAILVVGGGALVVRLARV
jgi:tight adherence protein B